MILVDANLLVYARVRDMEQHAAARDWLDGELNGSGQVGLPWPSLLAFVRIVTNPRIFPKPERGNEAWSQVEDWLDRPAAWIPLPSARHRSALGELLANGEIAANLVPDAHLAALALEHGLTVATTDADFGRFDSVRWINPLR